MDHTEAVASVAANEEAWGAFSELIALQAERARKSSAELESRIADFIKTHRHELLGALETVVKIGRWERGDLVHAQLKSDPKEIEATLGDPRWQTLRSLDLGWCRSRWLVGSSARNSTRGNLGEFLNACGALTTLSRIEGYYCQRMTPATRITDAEVNYARFDDVFRALPSLKRLYWSGHDEEVPWADPRLRQLEVFGLGGEGAHLAWRGDVVSMTVGPWGNWFAQWLATGPAPRRIEVSERVFSTNWHTQETFDVLGLARRRGARIEILTEAEMKNDDRWRLRR
ncbi:MAG: hypothetical protein QM817_00890 [Archangium sp.]